MTSICYEGGIKSWKPWWNTRQASPFTEKHDCNTRTVGKTQVVPNIKHAYSIKHQRVLCHIKKVSETLNLFPKKFSNEGCGQWGAPSASKALQLKIAGHGSHKKERNPPTKRIAHHLPVSRGRQGGCMPQLHLFPTICALNAVDQKGRKSLLCFVSGAKEWELFHHCRCDKLVFSFE